MSENLECQNCGDYYTLRQECEPTAYCDLCAQTMLQDAEKQIAQLTKERDELKHDIEAYRGALGYSVPGDHDGKLTDGTVPRCGLCNSEYRLNLEKERDELAAKCAALMDLSHSAYSLIIEHHSSSQMREELIECLCCTTKRGDGILNRLHAAYTNPDQYCEGWLSPEKKKELEDLHSHALLRIARLVSREKVLVKALERIVNESELWESDFKDSRLETALIKAKQALESAQ